VKPRTDACTGRIEIQATSVVQEESPDSRTRTARWLCGGEIR
jgi:hypothetical protein